MNKKLSKEKKDYLIYLKNFIPIKRIESLNGCKGKLNSDLSVLIRFGYDMNKIIPITIEKGTVVRVVGNSFDKNKNTISFKKFGEGSFRTFFIEVADKNPFSFKHFECDAHELLNAIKEEQ